MTLAESSGLRVGECIALELGQVLAPDAGRRIRIATIGHLRAAQSKGGKGGGPFVLTEPTRTALRAWLERACELGWLDWPAPDRTPLFLAYWGQRNRGGHERLSVRAAQRAWHAVQRRAGLHTRYGFHSLRHDAATRLRYAGGDTHDVKDLLRMKSIYHASRYVQRADALQRLPELAARALRV